MEIKELSEIFKNNNLNHRYNDKGKRIYLNDIENYTVYIEPLNKGFFVRVWKQWNKDEPEYKQDVKIMNHCKLIKYKVLKELNKFNSNNNLNIDFEPLPSSAETINLFPVKEKEIKKETKTILNINK